MKRHETRKIILGISAYLFPVLFLFLSPVIPFEGLLDGGVLAGAVVVFIAQFIFSIFFGRVFCGWICPGGAYQETFCSNMNSNTVNRKVDKIKFIIWLPWMLSLIFLAIYVGGIKGINFLYNTYFTRPIQIWGIYMIIYLIVSLIIFVAASVLGRRGFCHSICWMAPFMIIGKSLGRKLKLPVFKLKADSSKCIGCKNCEKNCAMSLNVMDMVKDGKIDSNECILCGKCIDSCPKAIIKYTFGK